VEIKERSFGLAAFRMKRGRLLRPAGKQAGLAMTLMSEKFGLTQDDKRGVEPFTSLRG
jgi:hypothetical protein